MKINFKSVGITLLVVSILLFGFCFTQTKVNINSLSPVDIVYACDSIKGLGDVTAQELIKNTPMANLETAKALPNIGEKKAKIINQHFTTIDTIRKEFFICSAILAIVLSVVGVCLISCHYERQRVEKEIELKERLAREKQLDQAFFKGR